MNHALGFIWFPIASGNSSGPTAPDVPYNPKHPVLKYLGHTRPEVLHGQGVKDAPAAFRDALIALSYQGATDKDLATAVVSVAGHLAYAIVPPFVTFDHVNAMAWQFFAPLAGKLKPMAQEVQQMPKPRRRIVTSFKTTDLAPVAPPPARLLLQNAGQSRPISSSWTAANATPAEQEEAFPVVAVALGAAAIGLGVLYFRRK